MVRGERCKERRRLVDGSVESSVGNNRYLGQLFASILSSKMLVARLRCSNSHDMITVRLNVAHCVRDSIFRDPIPSSRLCGTQDKIRQRTALSVGASVIPVLCTSLIFTVHRIIYARGCRCNYPLHVSILLLFYVPGSPLQNHQNHCSLPLQCCVQSTLAVILVARAGSSIPRVTETIVNRRHNPKNIKHLLLKPNGSPCTRLSPTELDKKNHAQRIWNLEWTANMFALNRNARRDLH